MSAITAAPARLATAAAETLDRHPRRFRIISWLAILVSFTREAEALALFAPPTLWDKGIAYVQTGLIAVAVWALSEYLDHARRTGLRPSRWVWAGFGLALVVSIGLQVAYLLKHKPGPEVLAPFWADILAWALAIFIPLMIGIAGIIRAEVEAFGAADARQSRDDRAERERAARELEEARAELARMTDEARAEREGIARTEAAAAAQRAETERERVELARLRDELARERAEAEAARAAATLNPVTLAREMIGAGVSRREAARIVGMAESTLRGKLGKE